MAKYTITCTCGHEYTFNICGPVRDRDGKAEWLAGQPCPKCRAAEERKAAEEAAAKAAAEAAERAAADNLPALTGSAENVEKAMAVRAEIIDELDRDSLVSGARAEIVAEAAKHTSAAWWVVDGPFSLAPALRKRAIVKGVIVARWCAMSDAERAAALAQAEEPQYRDSLEAGWAREAEKARLARLEPAPVVPPRPPTLQDAVGKPGARWNGKFYGFRVYLDGVEHRLDPEWIERWKAQWKAYEDGIAALRQYNFRAGL